MKSFWSIPYAICAAIKNVFRTHVDLELWVRGIGRIESLCGATPTEKQEFDCSCFGDTNSDPVCVLSPSVEVGQAREALFAVTTSQSAAVSGVVRAGRAGAQRDRTSTTA